MNKLLAPFVIIFCLLSSCSEKEIVLSEDLNETIFIRNEGSDMPVFLRGNALSNKLIILLHGGPGDSSVAYMDDDFALHLCKQYAFAFWDQRAQGNSHGHTDGSTLNIDQVVEDLHLLVNTMNEIFGDDTEIYLMGHSWGGAVGTAYLQKDNYQSNIAGFIQISGGYDFPLINKEVIKLMNTLNNSSEKPTNNAVWDEAIEFANSIDTTQILSRDDALTLNRYSGEILREHFLEEHYDIPFTGELEDKDISMSNSQTVTMNALGVFLTDDFLNNVLNLSLSTDLNKIEIPVLFVWGKYDLKVPPSLGQFAYEAISSNDKTFKIYEHAGHSAMNEDPTQFINDVKDFIN